MKKTRGKTQEFLGYHDYINDDGYNVDDDDFNKWKDMENSYNQPDQQKNLLTYAFGKKTLFNFR